MPTSKHKPPKPLLPPALVGICLGMILSIPIAALLARYFGDTYHIRVWIYGGILLWCILGSIVVFTKTYKLEQQTLSFQRIIKWCIVMWLWPLLLLH